MLGVITYVQGDMGAARSFAQHGAGLAQLLHDERGLMQCTETLAACEMEQGRYTEAQAFFEDNLDRARVLNDERGIAVTTGNLGLLALLVEDHRKAYELANESLALHRKLGDEEGMAGALNSLGWNSLLAADFREAESFLQHAVRVAANLGYKEVIASAIEGLAAALSYSGQVEKGAELLGAAERTRQESGVVLEPIERQVHDSTKTHLLTSMSEQRFDQLNAKGKALTLEYLLDLFQD